LRQPPTSHESSGGGAKGKSASCSRTSEWTKPCSYLKETGRGQFFLGGGVLRRQRDDRGYDSPVLRTGPRVVQGSKGNQPGGGEKRGGPVRSRKGGIVRDKAGINDAMCRRRTSGDWREFWIKRDLGGEGGPPGKKTTNSSHWAVGTKLDQGY